MLAKVFRVIDYVIESFVVLLFLTMIVVGGMQVFNRFFLGNPLTWSEEVQKYAHIWLIFLTIPICYRRGRHIGMEIITAKYPRAMQSVFVVAVDLLWFLLGFAISYYCWKIMQVASWQYSPSLEIRMDYVYAGEMAGGVYLMLTALRSIPKHFRSGDAASAKTDKPIGTGDSVC